MTTGCLYGLGLGPGDPELVTLKALRLLRAAPAVAYPAPEDGDSFARRTMASNCSGVVYCIISSGRTTLILRGICGSGLLTTVLGFVISLMSLGLTQSNGVRLGMVLAGIAVSLFGILGLINRAFLQNAIWKSIRAGAITSRRRISRAVRGKTASSWACSVRPG